MADKTDEALDKVQNAFDSAAAEAEQLSEAAKQDVQDALDELEQEIENLRNQS